MPVVGHGGLERLLRRRLSLIQTLLALTFGAGANELGFRGLLAGFSRGDLRFGLVDAGKGFGDPRVLQLTLATVVFDRRTGSRNCRTGLVNLCPIIVILQFDDQIALVYLLKVFDVNRAHDGRHLGAQRCKVATNVSIIGDLFDLPPSQAFQLRVMVIRTARASNTTRIGLRYFSIWHRREECPKRRRSLTTPVSRRGWRTQRALAKRTLNYSLSSKRSQNAAVLMSVHDLLVGMLRKGLITSPVTELTLRMARL